MRRIVALFALLLPRVALAETPCPPGDWFCEPEAEPASAPPQQRPLELELDPATSVPEEPPPPAPRAVLIDVERTRAVRPRRVMRREWGVGVHALIGLGHSRDDDGSFSMNGIGAAFRFSPIPHLALEGGFELASGTDYEGFDRNEGALLGSVLGIVNPRDPVRLYGLAGFSLAGAKVEIPGGAERYSNRGYDEEYSYVGAQLGVGVEVRISRRWALGADVLGFVRERTDDDRDDTPEFIEPSTGRTTNTSGGGLLRIGAFFYF